MIPANRRRRVPLTREVASELRGEIEGGRWEPGARLPGEPELALRMGVSRATLREAVRILVEDGLLRRVHGSGTYVARRPVLRNNLDLNFGVTELIRSTGRRPSTTWSEVEHGPADAETAEALGLDEGSEVVSVRRVRAADGVPVVLSIDILRAGLIDPSELTASIYTLLSRHGIEIHHGVARVSPARAGAELSRRLEVPQGTMLLCLEQVDFDQHGEPVVASCEYHLADAFDVTVYRRGPHTADAGT
ncbi:MAG: GntR family transcriptional regulator [Gaiellales bacterium]